MKRCNLKFILFMLYAVIILCSCKNGIQQTDTVVRNETTNINMPFVRHNNYAYMYKMENNECKLISVNINDLSETEICTTDGYADLVETNGRMYYMDNNYLKFIDLDKNQNHTVVEFSDFNLLDYSGGKLNEFCVIEADEHRIVNADKLYYIDEDNNITKEMNKVLSMCKYNEHILYADDSGKIILANNNFETVDVIANVEKFSALGNQWIDYNIGGSDNIRIYNMILQDDKLYFLVTADGSISGRIFYIDLKNKDIYQMCENTVKKFTVHNGTVYAVGQYKDKVQSLLHIKNNGEIQMLYDHVLGCVIDNNYICINSIDGIKVCKFDGNEIKEINKQ